MQKYRVKISRADFQRLQKLVFAQMPRESGAFMLAGISQNSEVCDILVRRVIKIPPDQFTTQHKYKLDIAPEAINGLVALCEANGLGAIVCHSHPEDIPYSPTDNFGEQRISETLRNFIPPSAPTASMLFYPGGIEARVWLPGQRRPMPIDEIVIIGNPVEKIFLKSQPEEGIISAIHNRQELAFGKEGQLLIQKTKVAIVGVGGTGSACAEQLARLGVNDISLIDFDYFEDTNLSRVYGSYQKDIPVGKGERRQKVDIIAEHLRNINPRAKITPIPKHIAESSAAMSLTDRDCIFLCTDQHWGRAIVNQISHQYLIPSINMGVRIDAKEGRIIGAMGNMDVLRADQPCLWCKNALSAERIAAESLSKAERQKRLREGYINDIDSKAPSVVSLNTVVAGLAVTNFLHLVTGFGGGDFENQRLNYFIMENEVSPGRTPAKDICICKASKARGDLGTLPTVYEVDKNILF